MPKCYKKQRVTTPYGVGKKSDDFFTGLPRFFLTKKSRNDTDFNSGSLKIY
ncbi:MAG: hypothetical protein IJV35_01420 [Neisseriaceae bacterium]|nr:hypothetical protein [Neisseriaceae bacterium]